MPENVAYVSASVSAHLAHHYSIKYALHIKKMLFLHEPFFFTIYSMWIFYELELDTNSYWIWCTKINEFCTIIVYFRTITKRFHQKIAIGRASNNWQWIQFVCCSHFFFSINAYLLLHQPKGMRNSSVQWIWSSWYWRQHSKRLPI